MLRVKIEYIIQVCDVCTPTTIHLHINMKCALLEELAVFYFIQTKFNFTISG